MRTFFSCLLVATMMVSFTPNSNGESPPPPSTVPDGWDLIFWDEFNDGVLDNIDYWNPDGKWLSGYPENQIHGTELQYYTRYNKNFSTECDKGGNNHPFETDPTGEKYLSLRLKKELGEYEVWHYNPFHKTCEPYNYTSGMVFSRNDMFLYGYFEIKCRIPNYGKILWPAFWLWAGDNGIYREIDIFEFGGDCENQCDPNVTGMNMHIMEDGPGSPITSYPCATPVPGPYNVTDYWHTYAVDWSPNGVRYYVDRDQNPQPIYEVAGHAPHDSMYIIANLAVAPWLHPEDLSQNCCDELVNMNVWHDFAIDHIRAYQSEKQHYLWQWGNGGDGQLHWWSLGEWDRFLSGDFDGDGRDELMAIANNEFGYAHMMEFSGGEWNTQWTNLGSGWIHNWHIGPTDTFYAGDFDGDGTDEILAVSRNQYGYAAIMKYNVQSGDWTVTWNNGGSGMIHWWCINNDDRFVVGDFNTATPGDELMGIARCIDPYAAMMSYDGSNWSTSWTNMGSGWIQGWHVGPEDDFVAGNFDGTGPDELLAVAHNEFGWAALLSYEGKDWSMPWCNGASGKIDTWYIHNGDRYLVGDVDRDGCDELTPVALNGWSHLKEFVSGDWATTWDNWGGSTMHLWRMGEDDTYVTGNFFKENGDVLLVTNPNGWAHLIRYEYMCEYLGNCAQGEATEDEAPVE